MFVSILLTNYRETMTYQQLAKNLPYNQKIFFNALRMRGVAIKQVGTTPIFRARHQQHTELIYDILGSAAAFTTNWIVSDKYYTKQVLAQAGLPVATGKVFSKQAIGQCCAYAQQIGYPVVVKPVNGGHGDFVYVDIQNEDDLRGKLFSFRDGFLTSDHVLIEKYYPGQEYRVFITEQGFLAAVNRVPARVIGDGKNSIINLIQIENYKRLNPRTNCLCEIKLDDVLFDHLDQQQLSVDYVPTLGEVVSLRKTSNVAKGGNCYDVTAKVHPSFRTLAQQVVQALPGVGFVGIDLICADITKNRRSQSCIICELNVAPGLSLHTLPETGSSQAVPAAVASITFPEAI
jgi:cyanophycin synthetase